MRKTNFNIKEEDKRKIRRRRGRKPAEAPYNENEVDDTPSKLGINRKRPYDDITPPKSIVQQSDDNVKNNWKEFMKMMQNNNQLKESKYMRKNRIRLSESQLNRVIRESVKNVLNESEFDYETNARNTEAIFEKVYSKCTQIKQLSKQCLSLLQKLRLTTLGEDLFNCRTDVYSAMQEVKNAVSFLPDLDEIKYYINNDKLRFSDND